MPHPRQFQIEDTSSSVPEEVVPHASVAESGACTAIAASKEVVEVLEENPLDVAIKEIVTTIEVPVIETVSLQEESPPVAHSGLKTEKKCNLGKQKRL